MTSRSKPADTAEDLTEDGFLGGRLTIRQPRQGYRAGVDPVLLAAAVPARSGEAVLDLGCGAGTAALCLAVRVPGLVVAGLERQPDYVALARGNADRNRIALDVHEGDLLRMPSALRVLSFDHVIANPPYFDAAARTGAADPGREAALSEETPLTAWCDAAIRRLAPGGRLTMILAAERLPDVLAGLDRRMGGVTIHPLAPREGRPASRIIVSARKGSRAPFVLAAPTVLHAGAAHPGDGEDYRPEIRAVLRDGAALPWIAD